MRIALLYSVLLLISTVTTSAVGAEGFYRPDELGTARDFLEIVQGATVLFEGRGADGRFLPIANGFFISRAGHILSNHHVATNCLGRNASPEERDTTRPREYEAGRGMPCRDFRARVFPNTSGEVVLRLEMIARPDRATIDRGGDFMILRAIGYQPRQFVSIARTRDFPVGTPYFMVGYPPITWRGTSSELIRRGVYSDVKTRGDYRVSVGEIVPKPRDYLHMDNPAPYFVGNGDGAAGTSGSLVITRNGNLLGFVHGYADPKGRPGNPFCLRDGKPTGMDGYFCPGALMNYLRASWILDRMDEGFPRTVEAVLRASTRARSRAR